MTPAAAPAFTESEAEITHQPGHYSLYCHVKCPHWGMAVMAWQQGDRRGYLFQDGKLRVFKEGYYSLLERQTLPADEAARITSTLHRQLGITGQSRSGSKGAARAGGCDFAAQLRSFKMQYPDGFGDDAWVLGMRGTGAKKRLKRHREPAMAMAAELLAKDELDGLIAAGDFAAVHARIRRVLAATDLVSHAHLKKAVDKLAGYRGLALALRALLYGSTGGDGDFAVCLDNWIAALTVPSVGKPSWPLATALPALLLPGEHVCVRPSTITAQAEIMVADLDILRAPHSRRYDRVLELARAVKAHLEAAGLAPRDFLDVYDFMWTTLRPAARKLLSAAAPADATATEALPAAA